MAAKDKPTFTNASTLSVPSWQPSTGIKGIIFVQLLLITWQFSPMPCDNGDNAKYYILGKSIIEGRGYRNIHMPGEPLENQYPIVFPAILAFAQVFSDNFVLPKVLVAVAGMFITLLSYYLFRDRLKYLIWPFIILVALSGQLVSFSVDFMSEVPFLFFTVTALLLLEKSLARPDNRLLFWAAIIVSVAPIHTRSAGIAFTVAWIAANILSKNWRYALMHAIVAGLTVALFRSFCGSNPYMNFGFMRDVYNIDAGMLTFSEWFARLLDNINKYGGYVIRNTMIPFSFGVPPFINRICSTVVIFLIFVGWLRCVLRTDRLCGLYVFFYMGMLLIFHWPTDRYIVPLYPFLLICILLGFDALVQFFNPQTPQPPMGFFKKLASADVTAPSAGRLRALWILVGVMGFFNVYMVAHNASLKSRITPDWINFYRCADWVRTHTPADAVVISRKPDIFYLRSKRKGSGYLYTHDVEKLIDHMDKLGATHVVHDNFAWSATTARYLYPAIAAHPERFKIVYALKDPDTFVLEVLPK